MRHGKLHSVGHNFADSLASGFGCVPGLVGIDVFGEAISCGNGVVSIDFLRGTTEGNCPDGALAKVMPLLKEAFPGFCEKHGLSSLDFAAFTVRFFAGPDGVGYVVTIEDNAGRRSAREYRGLPGARSETVDSLGRRRPKTISTDGEAIGEG